MQITFHGAAQTVTGSMHLIETAGRRILLECGLYQGARAEARLKNERLPFNPESLDAVVLSHAHIDHSGNLPSLVKAGYRGRIYATRATADLAEVMLEDSAQIQTRDYEYLKRKGKPVEEPLYEAVHARATARLFRGVDYGEWFDVLPGVRARFQDAGHIIGSATVHLEIREPGKPSVRITFTGDLGRESLPILRAPEPLPEAEIVLTESTYGGRCHNQGEDAAATMKTSLEKALLLAARSGGKLLIPAFSVGRTQNVLYYLNALMDEGRIPVTRIFIDSPLSVEATEILRKHPECFDEETLAKLEQGLDPLIGSHVDMARTVEESKAINRVRGTCVIISASGMCEFGRILHHLSRHLPDPNSVIAFVGFQADRTLGRRIVEGGNPVRIYGDSVPVNARILRLDGFSAHADHNELMAALTPLRASAGRIFVIHGDPEPANALATDLRESGFSAVDVPAPGDSFPLS